MKESKRWVLGISQWPYLQMGTHPLNLCGVDACGWKLYLCIQRVCWFTANWPLFS